MTEPTVHLSGEILFAGDWHGSILQAMKTVHEADRRGIKTIVQLGDFGIWRDDTHYLTKLSRQLRQRGMALYFVDGNHEDFPRLLQRKVMPDGTRVVRENIIHLGRGVRIDWDGLSVLALGGAASIDKRQRREGYSWWPEELISDDEAELAIAGGTADMMWCHDSPATAPNSITDDPIGQGRAAAWFGGDMLDYCNAHRVRLAEVTNAVRPRILLHGHYHMFMAGNYRHADGTTAYVRGLDQGLGTVERCTAALTPDGVRAHIQTLDNILSTDIIGT